DANFLGCVAILAILAHRFEDSERARKLYALLAPFESHAVVFFIQPTVCLGAVSRYLGLLAETIGETDLAARHFEDAIAMNMRMGARPYLARTQVEYARALLARGRADDRAYATRLIAEARATASSLGQHMLREQLAALTVEPSRSSPSSGGTSRTSSTGLL